MDQDPWTENDDVWEVAIIVTALLLVALVVFIVLLRFWL